jgi:hypothetical protein
LWHAQAASDKQCRAGSAGSSGSRMERCVHSGQCVHDEAAGDTLHGGVAKGDQHRCCESHWGAEARRSLDHVRAKAQPIRNTSATGCPDENDLTLVMIHGRHCIASGVSTAGVGWNRPAVVVSTRPPGTHGDNRARESKLIGSAPAVCTRCVSRCAHHGGLHGLEEADSASDDAEGLEGIKEAVYHR